MDDGRRSLGAFGCQRPSLPTPVARRAGGSSPRRDAGAQAGWPSRRLLPTGTAALILAVATLGACAGLPPGASFPKTESVALAQPQDTRLGSQFAAAARAHGDKSGFRIISVGVDGFAARLQMIDAAEQTLDLQYYIFRGDETGRLLTDALLRAAARGVRVRLLIDDGDTVAGDEQVLALAAQPGAEVRVFNPFRYRGHWTPLRFLEFLFNAQRLDYRMHNKLLVVDNAVALIGGRNIGNQYFQVDPETQFADDDVVAAGPVAGQLSARFDEYWNSALAIPAQALGRKASGATALAQLRSRGPMPSAAPAPASKAGGVDYVARGATGEPYAGIVAGRLPLVWAEARVVCDSPDKKLVASGVQGGRLLSKPVAATARAVQSELLMVTPYFVPAEEELGILGDLRQREVRVRILTNSLESAPDPAAHAGYMHYRTPLLKQGVQLYEVRSRLGDTRGSGQTARMSSFGNYALHGKLYVFDGQQLFIGSMNFDQRSKRLNTEVGLIIDSSELASQTVGRFNGMTQPENAYHLVLLDADAGAGSRERIAWDTLEGGAPVEYTREPARSAWQRLKVRLLSLLPLSREL